MKAVIVIPAHNEANTIAEVIRGARSFGRPLVVDDGSTDDTGARAARAGAEVLRLARNRGYEGALEAGFERAAQMGAEAVVTFDADGQLDPAVLEAMLAPLKDGRADLVLGTRPAPARFSERLFNLYARLRFGVPDILCGVKAYRMSLYRERGRFDGGRSVGTELALASLSRGVGAAFVPVPVRPRPVGRPRYGSWWRANLKILRALGDTIRADVSGAWRR